MKRHLRAVLTLLFLSGVIAPVLAAPLVSMEGQGSGSKKSANTQIASAPSEAPADSEYHCEVMSINGVAYVSNRKDDRRSLKQGDLLKVNDVVEVSGGWVDVAFDARWQNVTRIEGDSKFTVRALFPTGLTLVKGAIYARLKELPEGSSFEIKTPTAVATVRGTEFRTSVDAEGKTEVSSFSESPVYVVGVDLRGAPSAQQPTVLKNSEVTQVARPGFAPIQPRRMTTTEMAVCRQTQAAIETRVGELNREGRVGKIQNLDKVKRELAERRQKETRRAQENKGVPGGPGGPGGPGSGKSDGGTPGNDGNFGGQQRVMGEPYQIGPGGERVPVSRPQPPQNPDWLDRPPAVHSPAPAAQTSVAGQAASTQIIPAPPATFAPQPVPTTAERQPFAQTVQPLPQPGTTAAGGATSANDVPAPPPPPKIRQENG